MNRYGWFSVLIHAVIVAVLLLCFHENIKIGNGPVVKAYLYKQATPISKTNRRKQAKDKSKKTKQKVFPLRISHQLLLETKKTKVVSHKKIRSYQNITQASHVLSGRRKILAIYLHNQIQDKIVYPEGLPDFIGARSIVLQFTLTPAGEIKALAIQRSSGVSSMDVEAMNVIKSMQPVSKQYDHLTVAHRFTIKVNFR